MWGQENVRCLELHGQYVPELRTWVWRTLMKAGRVRVVHREKGGVITLVRQQDAPEARHGHVSNKFPFCLSHLGYAVFVSCNRRILVHKTWSAQKPGSTRGQPLDPFVHIYPIFSCALCSLFTHLGKVWHSHLGMGSLIKPALGDIYFPEQDILVGSQKRCLLSLCFILIKSNYDTLLSVQPSFRWSSPRRRFVPQL